MSRVAPTRRGRSEVAHSSQVASGPPRAPRFSRGGSQAGRSFSAHATYRSLVGHCSGVAWSGAGAAASFAWSLALEAESAAIEGEDADHHGEAVVHQPG